MSELTLEQAAEKHSTHTKSPVGSILYIHKTTAFKAGAGWQKEQYKRLIELAEEAANTCANEGDFTTATALNEEIVRLEQS